MEMDLFITEYFDFIPGSCSVLKTKMTSGNNIETEYLELNKKNDWQGLYQVFKLFFYLKNNGKKLYM